MPLRIVLTGDPDWSQTLAAALRERGCEVVHIAERDGYIARLADTQASLVVVSEDGSANTDWRFWIIAAKVNPATRRVPVIALAEGQGADDALHAGADIVLPPDTDDADLLLTYARPHDRAAQALADQCGEPLPAAAHEAIARFNTGDYYRQHDLFEALWVAETRPIRDLYRAVLQVGIAYYQIEQDNGRGAHKMLLRAVQWLAPLPAVCQGIDIAQLRADAAAVRAALEAHGYDAAQVSRELLRPVVLL